MKKKFNVIVYDCNKNTFEEYDVLPYLKMCYEKKDKKPETFDEFKKFVKDESMYQFWSRCEYEMICHGWPVKKREYKLDVHEQIMMNINIIAEILYNEINHNDK